MSRVDRTFGTDDTIEIAHGFYLRTAHYKLGPAALVEVGDSLISEVSYRAREHEFCTEYCLTCRELITWAFGYSAVYQLEQITVGDIECTIPRK